MKKKICMILIAVFVAVLGTSTYFIIDHHKESNKQAALYGELADLVNAAAQTDAATEPVEQIPYSEEKMLLPELAELYQQNGDLVGWISIADTNINYPVMQSVNEPNFYLKHGFDKEYSDYGCPYVQEDCDVQEPSDNLVIYGHHMQGKKVLLVDADPQGDLTTCLGWQDTDSLPQTLSNKLSAVMREEQQDPFSGILSHEEKVDLVPSNLDLSALEMSLVTAMSRESVMKNYLSQVKDRYDYVLIDCMPSLGMITLNALTAADSVIIPVQAQYLPAKGMTQLLSTIAKVKKHTNRNLTIDGILLTLVDGRTNLAKSTVEALRENFGCRIRIYRTTIPVAVKAAEVSSKGKSIYAYEPTSTVSKAYTDFTKEVLADGRQKERLHASHEHAR